MPAPAAASTTAAPAAAHGTALPCGSGCAAEDVGGDAAVMFGSADGRAVGTDPAAVVSGSVADVSRPAVTSPRDGAGAVCGGAVVPAAAVGAVFAAATARSAAASRDSCSAVSSAFWRAVKLLR